MNANYISLKCSWTGLLILLNTGTTLTHAHTWTPSKNPAISATLATASSHSPDIEMEIKKVTIFISVICRNPVESEHNGYVQSNRCGVAVNQCSMLFEPRRSRRRNFELTDHKSIYFPQVVSILINSLSTLISVYELTYYIYTTRHKQHSVWVVSCVCCAQMFVLLLLLLLLLFTVHIAKRIG